MFCIIPLGTALDIAQQAGTLPMQVLMLAAVIFLGGYIIRSNNNREKENSQHHEENKKQYENLFARLQSREEAFDVERKSRIETLMGIMQADTTAKNNIASAIANNTTAIEQLKNLIKDQHDSLKELLNK